MSKKANLNELHKLHKVIANYYIEAAESGEELSSGTLAAINAFLKNNNIAVDVIEESPEKNFSSRLKLLIKDQEEDIA
jgi:ABC-type Zn uptake system ZnuABC Zn-binding protein ZnuA